LSFSDKKILKNISEKNGNIEKSSHGKKFKRQNFEKNEKIMLHPKIKKLEFLYKKFCIQKKRKRKKKKKAPLPRGSSPPPGASAWGARCRAASGAPPPSHRAELPTAAALSHLRIAVAPRACREKREGEGEWGREWI